MKKTVLAVALVTLMAVAAEAQVTLTYQRENRNSSLSIGVSSYSYSGFGYGYGFGYGGFGGYGAAGSYGPGLVANVGGGTLTFGTRHLLPYYGGGYGGYGMYGGGYGYGYGTYAGYGADPYHPYGTGTPRPIADYSPAPRLRPGGVADRTHEHVSAKEIEEGRRRFRWGDYRGALDEFRTAVTADAASGLAHLYFAAALAVAGDGKNADKALRTGVDKGVGGKAALDFRDEKERTRIAALLGKVTGDGSLAAAFALSLAGDAERLKKLAEKDPAAKKLLGP